MNLNEYRAIFLLVTLALTLVASSPLFSSVISLQNDPDSFSEIWLLGPDHVAENFPFNVTSNEMYSIFLDVANHMGHSDFYLVKAKFRNITQSVSELSNSEPSSLPSIYDFRISVADETLWESPVNFEFCDISIDAGVLNVGSIVFNNFVLPLDASTTLNAEDNCFYFQLFFELWRYNVNSQSFIFDNKYVGIWLNMTISQ